MFPIPRKGPSIPGWHRARLGNSAAVTIPVRSPYRPLDPSDPRRFTAPRELDVLVPTCNRPAELAATLAGLAGQAEEFGVVVSDQSDVVPGWQDPAPGGLVRVLRHRGHPVLLRHHLPRRGMAEQRAFLLRHSIARYVLFLDDDVWLEPGAIGRMLTAIQELGCGFVGNAPHGLSYVEDYRPEQQQGYEEWSGRPHPEQIRPRGPQWSRASVHSAANLVHLTEGLGLGPGEWRAYKVAWIGACVLFDRAKLIATGGFDFWSQVPPQHEGEDVTAQLRVISRYGGAGVLPSGAYHLESPTTVSDRSVECFDLVPVSADSSVWRTPSRVGTRESSTTREVTMTRPPESASPEQSDGSRREEETTDGVWRDPRRLPLNELTEALGTYATDGQADDPTGSDAGAEASYGHDAYPQPQHPAAGQQGTDPEPDPDTEEGRRLRPSPEGRTGPG